MKQFLLSVLIATAIVPSTAGAAMFNSPRQFNQLHESLGNRPSLTA